MAKRDKILQQWTKAKDEQYATVEAVLRHYGFTLVSRTGSHCVYEHAKLRETYARFKNVNVDLKKRFGPDGQLTVPLRGGQKVAGVYLRDILVAVEIVTEGDNGNV